MLGCANKDPAIILNGTEIAGYDSFTPMCPHEKEHFLLEN